MSIRRMKFQKRNFASVAPAPFSVVEERDVVRACPVHLFRAIPGIENNPKGLCIMDASSTMANDASGDTTDILLRNHKTQDKTQSKKKSGLSRKFRHFLGTYNKVTPSN